MVNKSQMLQWRVGAPHKDCILPIEPAIGILGPIPTIRY